MKKYVLITGGGLGNNGAQAMMFLIIQELRINYPGLEPFVVLPVAERKMNRSNLNFQYAYDNPQQIYNREFLKDIECILDISGYALSSHGGTKNTVSYLNQLKTAQKYGIPVYLLPQSFGPFEYQKFTERLYMKLLMHRYLKYPRKICAREREGYHQMRPYCGMNLVKTTDLVLGYKYDIQPQYVYKKEKQYDNHIISEKSVAFIPSVRVITYGDGTTVIELYARMIRLLIEQCRSVYLIFHSDEDRLICRKLKSMFEDKEEVILFSGKPDCIQFPKLIKKFDFAISSRYHSIVFAYKSGIPCIAIGWAEKYKELLEQFKQEKYLIDIRNNVNSKMTERTLFQMLVNYENEQSVITREYARCPDIMEELKYGGSK